MRASPVREVKVKRPRSRNAAAAAAAMTGERHCSRTERRRKRWDPTGRTWTGQGLEEHRWEVTDDNRIAPNCERN